MIVRAGILSFCATGTGMKAYLLAAKCPNCWVTKHVFLYGHMSVVCAEQEQGVICSDQLSTCQAHGDLTGGEELRAWRKGNGIFR
jgi:hypothetical protein